ncbi:hypothetical protein MUGA111182_06270 [Mucilaginibacter galii]|uniref:Uncharacterized protein n=1 Tax=Mucilaginibacter galii TaxID=2005073 RepID=A0A917JAX0_9SPHI|nr:hypothetical protein [Mucilaginibacter galii]GGI51744.1 hypothetical protein GCM10011425_29560 [Mucilaginibacter galii]
MQGINKAKHVHLIDALLQMEILLSREQVEFACIQQTVEYRRELEDMHSNYERLLEELSGQISAYEALFSQVKVQYLSRKLKELKKEISIERPAYPMLAENIRLAHSI